MKQVTYSIDWKTVARAIVATHSVDDGHWMLDFTFESIPCTIPRMITQQVDGIFPGVIVRAIGAKMTQVDQPSDLTIEVRNGQIYVAPQENTDGANSDNGGSKPSSKGSRKNR